MEYTEWKSALQFVLWVFLVAVAFTLGTIGPLFTLLWLFGME